MAGRLLNHKQGHPGRDESGWHPVFDVGEHRRHLVHAHPRVQTVEGRLAAEHRMRGAKPLADGVNSVEGPLGKGDDLGQEHQPIRLVGGQRAGCAPTAQRAGGDAEDRGESRV